MDPPIEITASDRAYSSLVLVARKGMIHRPTAYTENATGRRADAPAGHANMRFYMLLGVHKILGSFGLKLEGYPSDRVQCAVHNIGITRSKQSDVQAVLGKKTLVKNSIKPCLIEHFSQYLSRDILACLILSAHRSRECFVN